MNATKQFVFSLLFCTYSLLGYAQNSSGKEEDSLGIIVTQNSSYLLPGDELEISVFQSCESRYPMEKVTIGGARISFYKKGIASFKTIGGSPGSHTIPVNITFRDSDGLVKEKSFAVNYTVGQFNAIIALDRMNVIYIGIDNPVSVAASGAGDEKMIVRVKGGGASVAKVGNGRYLVRASKVTDDCVMSMYVGERILAGYQFRVRNLPVPIGTVGGYTSGDSVSAAAFALQQGVAAFLKDFPFELKYSIIGYTINIHDGNGQVKSATCKGADFTDEAKQLIKQYLKRGTMVTIGSLFAKAPDGRQLKLLPLLYHIK